MNSPLSELLSTPCGTVAIVMFDPPGAPPGYDVPALAVHAPAGLAQAAGTGKLQHCAMTVSVVEREGVAFFFFGMAVEGMLFSFVVNPGQEGVLLFLEYLKAQHMAPVFLVFDEQRAAVTAQGLPRDKLEAALEVARRKPIYTPEQYNRVLTDFVRGRTELEVASSLFARQELVHLMLQAQASEGAVVLH